MTYVMSDYHGHREPLSSPDEAGEWFDEQSTSIMPNGSCGQVIWFGPTDEPAALRVDVDVTAGLAALRWVPDGSYAVEREPTDPISVIESPDSGAVTVSAELVRVSPATARRAVVEYVSTGLKPTSVSWLAGQ